MELKKYMGSLPIIIRFFITEWNENTIDLENFSDIYYNAEYPAIDYGFGDISIIMSLGIQKINITHIIREFVKGNTTVSLKIQGGDNYPVVMGNYIMLYS